MNMTLAIPVWEEQVSTTFDFARRVLIVKANGGREVARSERILGDGSVESKARVLRDQAVQVVICGAISQALARVVAQAGIQILPYVTGHVDMVLAAYLCGRLGDPCFLQPGCRSGARRRWRNQGGFCHKMHKPTEGG